MQTPVPAAQERFSTKAMRQNAAVREVDTLLVLATDVSNSVIKERWDVQRNGYAAALANEEVQKALLSGPRGAIGLCLIQWSSYDQQKDVIPWTFLDSREMIGVFSSLLQGMERQFSNKTGIGAALRYCASYLDEAPFRAERAVIDVSGDGYDNQPLAINEVVPLPQIRLSRGPRDHHQRHADPRSCRAPTQIQEPARVLFGSRSSAVVAVSSSQSKIPTILRASPAHSGASSLPRSREVQRRRAALAARSNTAQ